MEGLLKDPSIIIIRAQNQKWTTICTNRSPKGYSFYHLCGGYTKQDKKDRQCVSQRTSAKVL